MDVALVTYVELPNLAEDDQILLDALQRRGLSVWPAIWDDPQFDWSAPKLAVIRSTWDYHHRLAEFLAWARLASRLTTLWNPLQAIEWNTHKTYLRDLEARGVPIVPTVWLEARSQADLADVMASQGWQRVVVKPAVSASAFGTVMVTPDSLAQGQVHLEQMLSAHDMMVQPYISSVSGYGERSFMLIEGELTHAVRRAPVLNAASSSEHKWVMPTEEEAALAEEIVAASGFSPLYARVDLVRDDEDQPRLMELELVEPSLFFEFAPEAAERMAEAIAEKMNRRRFSP
ncbi:MAG TPA: hypothetical protein VEX13_13740 [Chloroflexia bacterium]|nr:hypothetical protein [Chloroflexia bacterium]